jgi:hypothetical protein
MKSGLILTRTYQKEAESTDERALIPKDTQQRVAPSRSNGMEGGFLVQMAVTGRFQQTQ